MNELLNILAGRHDCWSYGWNFPFENGAIQMNRFCVEGKVTWEVWLQRHFWNEVRKGNLGLDPVKLFRREYVN